MKVEIRYIDTQEVVATFPSWEDYTNAMPNGIDEENSKIFEIAVSKWPDVSHPYAIMYV